MSLAALTHFLSANSRVALVEVADARGSTPREKGAWMLVSKDRTFGTIGGGQLEYMAIDKAREMLGFSADGSAAPHPVKDGERGASTWRSPSARPSQGEGNGKGQRDAPDEDVLLDIPLGPEIGQCCGGRVRVRIRHVDAESQRRLLSDASTEDARLPHVYVFGGGHVGRAIASAMSLLPVRTIVVETRADALDDMPGAVRTRLTPVPEELAREAPPGSAFVVLTHDHALDFLIVAQALGRTDAAYVGMIGSRTKKATFRSWFLKNAHGTEEAFSRLVSPIGGDAVKDKRPAVIAALAAAEIMTELASTPAGRAATPEPHRQDG